MTDIPEDIKVAARLVVNPFLTARGRLDGMALDYAVAAAINAERKRWQGEVERLKEIIRDQDRIAPLPDASGSGWTTRNAGS